MYKTLLLVTALHLLAVSGSMAQQKTLLAIFPHPDDETAIAEVLLKHKAMGYKVQLIIATNGKDGTRVTKIPAGDSLGNLRKEESRCACKILGIEEPIFLGIERLDTRIGVGNYFGSLLSACRGVHCVVSALSGLREVIVDAQTALLTAAVDAGVPRFIPSDYCIDYTKLPDGSNRNLDLRREFSHRLDAAPIAATSVLNGMFTDLLLKEAPLIQAGLKRVLYWGKTDQLLDFTTIDNTAAFTAQAALDEGTPRYLCIAGDVVSSRDLAGAASRATGHHFKATKVGGLGFLKTMITITKTLLPQPKEVFPPWQGMQYLYNMYTGLPKLHPLDNDRYPGVQWTSVEEVLKGLK